MTDRITAILDHWLGALPPGVREGLVEDIEELVDAPPDAVGALIKALGCPAGVLTLQSGEKVPMTKGLDGVWRGVARTGDVIEKREEP